MNFLQYQGLREDVLEILLNLKEIIFKSHIQGENFGRLKVQGPAIVTASYFDLPSNYRNSKPKSIYCNNF